MTAVIRVIILLLVLISIPLGLSAQDADPPPPCSTPEFHQFDFWLGQWNLAWPDSGKGTNTVTTALDDCVIEENFVTTSATPFRGRLGEASAGLIILMKQNQGHVISLSLNNVNKKIKKVKK